MESIQEPNQAFPFSNLVLTPPTNSSGGNHFMRFSLNDNPLYIQTPKCKTKQAVVKTTNKRAFLDLTFTNENEEFIQWVENLETHCQKFIYSKRERWFDSTLEESDIENLFTSILKPMKMGKFYLLRVNTPLAASTLKIYDENENLMNLEDLKEDTNIVCILEFQGIKCSARGFQVDIEVKQILVLKPANIFDRCILSKKRDNSVPISPALESSSTIVVSSQIDSEQQDRIMVKVDDINDIGESEVCNTISIKEEDQMADEQNLEATLDNVLSNTTKLDLDVREEDLSELKQEKTTEEKLEESFTSPSPFPQENKPDLLEIDLNLEEVPPEDSMVLKQRNDVYYEMYKEALKKAKMAKDLALSSYLEAKRIKNLYMLDDLSDDSELEDFVGEEEDTDEE